jgi:hypothetical protein
MCTLECKEVSEIIILSSLCDMSTQREQATPDVCLNPCKLGVWTTASFVALLGTAAIGLLGDGNVVRKFFLKASNSSLETEKIVNISEKLILQVYFINQRFMFCEIRSSHTNTRWYWKVPGLGQKRNAG